MHGARRRQALPARGLLKGSCFRRHAALQGAWRRQAVPAQGLHQVRSRRYRYLYGVLRGARRRQAVLQVEGRLSQGSCSRRHATLVMNLQSSILMAQTTCMPHCLAHGGGRRCQKEGCSKSVAHAPGSVFCARPVCGAHCRSPTARNLRCAPASLSCELRLGGKTCGLCMFGLAVSSGESSVRARREAASKSRRAEGVRGGVV
jgi:hypothetical protein